MEISTTALRAKRSCASGYRWFARRFTSAAEYLKVIDALVDDGRVDDACWLIDRFGPVDTVRVLDELSAPAFAFPGSLQVRHGVDVDTVLRVGGSLSAGGGVRAGTLLVVDADLRCGGGLQAERLRCGGDVVAGWSVEAHGSLVCRGDLRVQGDLGCVGALTVGGTLVVAGDLEVGGHADCGKSLRAGGHVVCGEGLKVGHGVQAAGDVRSGVHLDAGWGVVAGGDIVAEGAIRAGESLVAGGEVRSGDGYGVHAGSSVRREAWSSCGRVVSRTRPGELRSGAWLPAAEGA
ncbi:hypothetical protein [Rubrivivax benzoatilyticus]|uniref:DUF342 domain-containing protein n=1 Tax=Rubrivivax benzoatilyticus TaxID=316997 RepID=A0ABX0HXA2_9BURK|nr:hypothetical protein [Rubrivivax benzoatilyticus]EGJ10750.1 hypothetical protein RBXJA2T_10509 [Rubrivivax benzoatilyticus JA2 = ATCC BAA-35]NHK99632.1 hypothetical protein [Rubrivivax benzoatilyticus]NHL25506.1 hypothetical protein [Rubrivivax benzoatilyticus]